MIDKDRKNYLLNNLLLFIKQEMEDCGANKDNYFFVKKFSQPVHYFGEKEPRIEQGHPDTLKFLSKCPCEENELDAVINYALANEFLERKYSGFKITYSGFEIASEYELFLENVVVDGEIILNDYKKSGDDKINEMVVKSRNLYLTKDLDGALEKIWDAFERIKSIYQNLDKKESAERVCRICATSLCFDDIDEEFKKLTHIGNTYQIRHFETNKQPIEDINTKIYLYFRVLCLVIFVIKQLENKND